MNKVSLLHATQHEDQQSLLNEAFGFNQRGRNLTGTYGLDGLDKKALEEEYKEWIEASEGSKDQPHVLYANQINI